ncbi:25052_t:CDS:10 [Cetraspora pellucida]|uniref:Autophagy-related protein n=1 Tax=Cetraspora pellucida TaxID=1433469 RepID=A0A9N9FNJ6_9GLOM|nr:25052_t:CDS:10 [Cetraspora pellucida]
MRTSEEEKDYENAQNEDDSNPLTKKELIGWYLHNFAVGVYDVAAISVFIPVVLETLSAQAGYELDQVTPCNTTITNYKCVTRFGESFIDTESYPLYIIAISVLFQAILFISCGSLADHGNSRKKFLLSFSFTGAISTIAFIVVVNPTYIPIFSRCHPDVIKTKHSGASSAEIKALEYNITTKLSSYSMVADLTGGLVVLIAGLGILLTINDLNDSIGFRLALVLCGVWWLFFLIFPTMWLTSRPRPPLPKGVNYFAFSWKRVGKTLMSTRELWQTMKLLFAWFFISDGQNTIITVCVLFGKKGLGMTDTELSLFAIIVPICGVIGMSLLPLYALLGFWLPFGLVNKWEVWVYLVVFGLLVGSLQGYCQAFFAIIIPEGHENEFFSLFQITARGSSAIGPLVSGAITDFTHEIRLCFWFLLAIIALPIFIIATLDIEKGKSDAKAFIRKEEEMNNNNNH